LRLTARTGALYVVSSPVEGEIYLDGRDQERRTPGRLEGLLPGNYRVTVKREGFEDGEATATVTPERTTTVTVSLREGAAGSRAAVSSPPSAPARPPGSSSLPSSWPTGYVYCGGAATAIVDVTNPTTGKIWMDRNLGASRAATRSTDAQSYGDLYQWGRFADGHQCRTSSTTSTRSSTDRPGHGSFITSFSFGANWDWRIPQNTNLWQGVNGVNNPCPGGYRLPTAAELEAERSSWSSNNAAGAFASPLKWPVAGDRYLSSGSLLNVGSYGLYWSSTVDGTNARYLAFASSDANMFSIARAFGFSVRCIND
jgi:uncharacterized protein (TIGR02145 family)